MGKDSNAFETSRHGLAFDSAHRQNEDDALSPFCIPPALSLCQPSTIHLFPLSSSPMTTPESSHGDSFTPLKVAFLHPDLGIGKHHFHYTTRLMKT